MSERKEGKNGRVYTYEGRDYPSVTSILKLGVPKPALIKWAARLTAEEAVNSDSWKALTPDKAIAYLTKVHERSSNERAARGSTIHAQAEALATGASSQSHEFVDAMGAYGQFIQDFRPEFEFAETTVYSDQYGYAGTVDWRAIINGRRYIGDTKTGRRIYPDVALQLAAYDRADFAVIAGERVDLRPAKRGLVLHLTDEGYFLRPVRVDDEVFDAFLAAYDMFTWATDTSQTVIREPLSGRSEVQLPASGNPDGLLAGTGQDGSVDL